MIWILLIWWLQYKIELWEYSKKEYRSLCVELSNSIKYESWEGDNLAIGTMPSDSISLLETKYTKDIGFTLKKNWHIYIIIFYKIVQTFIYLGKIGTPGTLKVIVTLFQSPLKIKKQTKMMTTSLSFFLFSINSICCQGQG